MMKTQHRVIQNSAIVISKNQDRVMRMAYIGTFVQIIASIVLFILIYYARSRKKKGIMIILVIALVTVNVFFTTMYILNASMNSAGGITV